MGSLHIDQKTGHQITPLQFEHMEPIRLWRNDQIDILRQEHFITAEEQKNYFQKVVLPQQSMNRPSMILYAYLLDHKLIGYGGLTNISWTHRRAEISFLLETARIHRSGLWQQDMMTFLKLLTQAARELKLHRLYTETFSFRTEHIQVLETFGLQLEGRMIDHVYINKKFVNSLIHGLIIEDQT